MARREEAELDCDLAELPPDQRWREWMRRIEAVLFASAAPVARDDLALVVGQGASVDLLIDDLVIDLEGRPYEVALAGCCGPAPPMPRRSAPRRMWGVRP